MDKYGKIKNNERPNILLCEDWFVRDKKIKFGSVRGGNDTQFDISINERIFDKPIVKTVIWDGA